MNSLIHSLTAYLDHRHIDFATTKALWLLLFLPAWWILRSLHKPPTITFSRADLVSRGPRSKSLYPTVLFILRNLLFITLIVALARPRLAIPEANTEADGINIALAVDLSSSMLAQDFQPKNRLEVAKQSVRNFILARNSDRIGLVVFASEAMTQVPLTSDYPVLLGAVENMQVGQLNDGTAIGDGIATAANRLRGASGKSRVMILLTDGVNNRGAIDPLTAARAALVYGIKIYTIGVGTNGVAPVAVGIGPNGKEQYTMQKVEVDEPLLTQIAEMTGGRYFRATNAATLQAIYRQINTLEKNSMRSKVPMHYAELFRWSLGSAAILLLMELAIAAVRSPIP